MGDLNYKREHDLDELLDQVDYSYLNSPNYFPSQFALTFMNFIKLVNGDQAGHNKTPPMHLAMLDKLEFRKSNNLANLMFRGAAKTSVFMEYMTPFIAVMEELPILGKIDGFIYVSDSIENGVKSARKNIEFRYEQSPFLQEWLPHAHFTDNYMEFKNKNGHRLGVKMFGAKALSLDSILYTEDGPTTMGQIAKGDRIYGPDGKLATVDG